MCLASNLIGKFSDALAGLVDCVNKVHRLGDALFLADADVGDNVLQPAVSGHLFI